MLTRIIRRLLRRKPHIEVFDEIALRDLFNTIETLPMVWPDQHGRVIDS